MAVKIYNTLSRKKEVFRPRKNRRVNIFVCGPTVYDLPHIGHARTYVAFDMFVKFLRQAGYKVFYLENITDIDDKIIKRAHEEGTTPSAIARKFTKAFLEDMKAIGVNSISRYAKASDFIPEIQKQVKRLMKRGFAYAAPDGSVYFRVRKVKDYGKLSKQKATGLKQFEAGEFKEDPRDFALWKAAKPGEPKWKSPWGFGRPGWHIEDTAISEKYFGPQYDIHGGGIDLIFPHHECEIAQQESASGRKPFVRYWIHTGHLKIGGTKMSKSLGNFVTIRELIKNTRPEILRLIVAMHHYRSPINYTDTLLTKASNSQTRIADFVKKVYGSPAKTATHLHNMGVMSALRRARSDFYEALADDFNTPRALASVFTLVAKLNPVVAEANAAERKKLREFFKEIDSILGIVGKVTEMVPARIRLLVARREKLRAERDWQGADKIRLGIQKAGWLLEDTPSGPRLKRKTLNIRH